MVPLASWGGGEGLIFFKVMLACGTSQEVAAAAVGCGHLPCAMTGLRGCSREEFLDGAQQRRRLCRDSRSQRAEAGCSAVPTFLLGTSVSDPMSSLGWVVGERVGSHSPFPLGR